ncbi:MAG: YbaK/EbsC family protein [Treponema sp.]|jgi:prolyl-tRNA editing enzyme YbaK/EbsC (Cys-tRNA(Pro) deacylase)|nr:YbaK/EbsC family protein [Treponema sp.]
MSIEQVRTYLSRWSRDKDIIEMDISTATVELAAAALGVLPARIAKTISLRGSGNEALLVVTAGDVKLDNRKFRSHFSFKPRMLSAEEALEATGHAIGGVCPFALPPEVKVYLDDSLKRFQTVFPACGSGNSAIELTLSELEEYSQSTGWIDVCIPKSV